MNVLILSPHTDDAELGSGGFIIKLLKQGHNIRWLVFSTAKESMVNKDSDITRQQFINVVDYLGVKNYDIYDFNVRSFDKRRQEILDILIMQNRNFKPNLIIGPSKNDCHQDHTVIFNQMVRAFKMQCNIICYQLPWNNLCFNNQMFVKLTKQQIDLKFKVLQFYHSQKDRKYFQKNFIYSIASVRGLQVNSEYAQCFQIIKWVL